MILICSMFMSEPDPPWIKYNQEWSIYTCNFKFNVICKLLYFNIYSKIPENVISEIIQIKLNIFRCTRFYLQSQVNIWLLPLSLKVCKIVSKGTSCQSTSADNELIHVVYTNISIYKQDNLHLAGEISGIPRMTSARFRNEMGTVHDHVTSQTSRWTFITTISVFLVSIAHINGLRKTFNSLQMEKWDSVNQLIMDPAQNGYSQAAITARSQVS